MAIPNDPRNDPRSALRDQIAANFRPPPAPLPDHNLLDQNLCVNPDVNLRSLPPPLDPVLYRDMFKFHLTKVRLYLQEASGKGQIKSIQQSAHRDAQSNSALFKSLLTVNSEMIADLEYRQCLESYIHRIASNQLDVFERTPENYQKNNLWLTDFSSPQFCYQHLKIPEQLVSKLKYYADRFFDEFRLADGCVELERKLALRPSLTTRDLPALEVAEFPLLVRYLVQESLSTFIFSQQQGEETHQFVRGVTATAANYLLNIISTRLATNIHYETALGEYSDRILKAHGKVRNRPEKYDQTFSSNSKDAESFRLSMMGIRDRHQILIEMMRSASKNMVLASYHADLAQVESPSEFITLEQIPFPLPNGILLCRQAHNDSNTYYQLHISAKSGAQSLGLARFADDSSPEGQRFVDREVLAVLPDRAFLRMGFDSIVPISESDIQRTYNRGSHLPPLTDTLTNTYQHLLSELSDIQIQLSEIFMRSNELPMGLGLMVTDTRITFMIPRAHADLYKEFFFYLTEVLASIDRQLLNSSSDSPIEITFARQTPDENNHGQESAQTRSKAEIRREVSRLLFSNVANFAELFNILRKHYGVELSNHGNGGHKGLHRGGYYFALSSNFRSETDPLNHQIAVKMLEALSISLEEFSELLQRY